MKSVGKADAADSLAECWKTVEIMAGRRKEKKGPKVSNRIKFMLQDLLEMKEKGKCRIDLVLCCFVISHALTFSSQSRLGYEAERGDGEDNR